MKEVRLAYRTLRQQPLFALMAIAVLAIGIGANTAVFSVAHAILLQKLPYANPDQLVFVTEIQSGTTNAVNVPPANYLDYAAARKAFRALGAAEAWQASLNGPEGVPQRIRGLRVSASLFDVLQVPPHLGRTFLAHEEVDGMHRSVVLSYPFWQARFGKDPAIVGRSIALNGESWQVIGVMPAGFRFAPFWATNAQVFVPLAWNPQARASRGMRTLRVFGRLQPGTTPELAQKILQPVFTNIEHAAPEEAARLRPSIVPLSEMVVGKVRPALMVLLIAVALVLFIACANLATLLLVRSIHRRREIGIRLALGASRAQLFRQNFGETLILSIAGGIVGVLLAAFGIDALGTWFHSALPDHQQVAINTPVLLFTLGVSIASAALLSLPPALEVSAINVNNVLKETGRSTSAGAWSQRLRRTLVATQVAFSVSLLLAAGLLLRSLLLLQAIDPGLDPRHVVTASVHTWGTSVAARTAQLDFYRQLLTRLASIPAVRHVALVNHLPLAGDMWSTAVQAEGAPPPRPGEQISAAYRFVAGDYALTMGLHVLRGRDLSAAADRPGTPLTAVVNETLSTRLWPKQDAIGKRLALPGVALGLTVVGVVRDVVQQDWIAPRKPEVYLALEQHAGAIGRAHTSSMALAVRTQPSRDFLLKANLGAHITSVQAEVPLTDVQSFAEIVNGATMGRTVYAALLGVLASSALVLAALGLYALVSYETNQRSREVGIRIALGAKPGVIIKAVVREALHLVLAGACVGTILAFVLARVLTSQLYGIKPTDPVTLFGVLLMFFAIAFAAAFFPARRSAQVDPLRALQDGR
jgi:predicted permease